MMTPEEILFKTTSQITIAELPEKYGEMWQGDIVFWNNVICAFKELRSFGKCILRWPSKNDWLLSSILRVSINGCLCVFCIYPNSI
jgi:hypothetical protein